MVYTQLETDLLCIGYTERDISPQQTMYTFMI
jgi:hypothetical protein